MHDQTLKAMLTDEPLCPGHGRHHYRGLELIHAKEHKYKNGLWRADRKTTCTRCGTIQLAYYVRQKGWFAYWLEREVNVDA